jgi:hypothetical protein
MVFLLVSFVRHRNPGWLRSLGGHSYRFIQVLVSSGTVILADFCEKGKAASDSKVELEETLKRKGLVPFFSVWL